MRRIPSLLAALPLVLLFSSCASTPFVQPEINSLVITGRLENALYVLNTKQSLYGKNNQLLFLLDKGLILHFAGRYQESIQAFESAKRMIDVLYTQSVTKIASSWLVNDYSVPYRGENFEHILVHIFQAINFSATGNMTEALVEAKATDLKLSLIKDLYIDDKDQAYQDDAFARLLMGIFYESTNNRQDINDAFISYQKALDAYESKFYKSQNAQIPNILIENLLASCQYLGFSKFEIYRKRFPNVSFIPFDERMKKSEIYVIQYNGLSPLKHPDTLLVPTFGILAKLSFPKYDERFYEIKSSIFEATDVLGRTTQVKSELGDDIESLAVKDLEIRKAGIYAKAIGRPILKLIGENVLARKTKNQHGSGAGYAVDGLSSLYNIYSEQADLRCWQTLPAQIRLAHLTLDPGMYRLKLSNFDGQNKFVAENDLGEVLLQAGEKKFIVVRTGP